VAILEGQYVEVEWHHTNKEWFIEKGYLFTKAKDKILVKLSDLKKGSKIEVQVNCDHCGVNFHQKYNVVINRENHFCCKSCYHEFRRENGSPNNTRVEMFCFNCNKKMKIQKYRHDAILNGKQEFITCSRQCQNEYLGKKNSGENNKFFKERLTVRCEVCENNFEIEQHRKGRAKYCSEKCRYIGIGRQNVPKKKKLISCYACGKTTSRWEHQINSYEYHFCSIDCRKELQGFFTSQQQKKKEDTEIQIIINEILKSKNIEYEQEKPFNYYAVDNYLTKHGLIIEVMGDYWHSNPLVYFNYNDLNNMQKNRVKVDKSKKTFLQKKYNINMLYLWETDIKNNLYLCEKLIELHINKNGELQDYNSFNYELLNGNLTMKHDDIINPYFLRSNTKRQVI